MGELLLWDRDRIGVLFQRDWSNGAPLIFAVVDSSSLSLTFLFNDCFCACLYIEGICFVHLLIISSS